MHAVENGYRDVVRLILKHMPKPSKKLSAASQDDSAEGDDDESVVDVCSHL